MEFYDFHEFRNSPIEFLYFHVLSDSLMQFYDFLDFRISSVEV